MQELNREAKTLGPKSVDMRNTNASVELKVLIDHKGILLRLIR